MILEMRSFKSISHRIINERSWYAAALVALSMPFFHTWSAIAMVLLFLVLLTDIRIIKRIGAFTKNSMLLPMIMLFVMYAIGLLYSSNREQGWLDLETSLPLLLFPIILPAMDAAMGGKIDFTIRAFIIGCLVAGLVCFASAVSDWLTLGINHFFYVDFSLFMHPSYFALYLNFALIYIYNQFVFKNGLSNFKAPVVVFIIFYINALLFLLSSKAGILTAALVQVTVLISSIVKRKNTKMALAIFIGLLASCIIFYRLILPDEQERIVSSERAIMNSPIEKTATESSSVRLLIWRSALPLIKETYLFGTGTGTVKDQLIKVYRENGITAALEKGLNAHNQFLQTLIAVGIIGFILLSVCLGWPFYYGIKTGNYLMYMFSLIVIFNCLFESIFERQIGIEFFAFFNTLLILYQQKVYTSSEMSKIIDR